MITRNSSQKIHAYGVFATQNSAVWQTEGFIAECLLPLWFEGEQNALLRGFPAVRLQTPGVLNGGMDAPAPRSPYASSCGIVSSHLEPTGIRVSASIQPGDHAINREFSGFTTSNGAVKHGAVDQFTGVMNTNAVSTCRNCAFTTG